MDGALKGFTEQEYGSSSMGRTYEEEGSSRGIVFHYSQTRDELYLVCMEECSRTLTGFLRKTLIPNNEPVHRQLQTHSNAGFDFFQVFPIYRKTFCESAAMPPHHLEIAAREQKTGSDILSPSISGWILAPLRLRSGIPREKVVDLFVQLQDCANVRYQNMREQDINFRTREEDCHKALDVLFYGVVKQREMAQ